MRCWPMRIHSRDQEERQEIESSEKNKLCLTKTMTPPLACWSSEERMSTRNECDQIATQRILGSAKRKAS